MNKTNVPILTPNEGCYLTQKNRKENEEPTLTFSVINGIESEWMDISIEEGDLMLKEWKEKNNIENELNI